MVIGLPGAGKSSVSRRLANRLKLGLFVSDAFCRHCRSLSTSCQDPEAEVWVVYLRRMKSVLSKENYESLTRARNRSDDRGNCELLDSNKFRIHGEDVFRIFEYEALNWAYSNQRICNKVPDIGGGVPLWPENRFIFSEERGFLPITLRTSCRDVARNLVKDYLEVIHRRESGDFRSIRGNFEAAFDAIAISYSGRLDLGEFLFAAALDLVRDTEARRIESYLKFSNGRQISPRQNADVEEIEELVMSFVDGRVSSFEGSDQITHPSSTPR